MYHRVTARQPDPYGLAVHPDRFAEQVAYLHSLRRTVPLDHVVGSSSADVAITFDDGYVDNASVAAPLLAEAGLPATWFIAVGRLGGRPFWWDRLAAALLDRTDGHPGIDVHVAGEALWLDLGTPAARSASLHFLWSRMLALAPEQLELVADDIAARVGKSVPAGQDVTMTLEQLKVVAALPGQQIGAHTRSHPRLRDKSEAVQRDEVLGSVDDLSRMLQRPVVDFAYPFGNSRADVGALAPRLVEEAGCRLACTTDEGPVRRRSDRYKLPRMWVGDWGADEFAAHLQAALRAR